LQVVLLSDSGALTRPQRRKVDNILTTAGHRTHALLLVVALPEHLPEGTICLSVLAHVNKRHEIVGPRFCFVEPSGRHHWQ